jgi:hypothetical protein
MNMDIRLRVWLKGVDLVTSTAYLTLCDKMGYAGRLLGIKRTDYTSFALASPDPGATVAALKRMLATQGDFYNRNKHNHLLECRWGDGDADADGTPIDQLLASLSREISGRQQLEDSQEFDGKSGQDRVILTNVPIFRTEVLVEDREPFPKLALAQRLESELAAADFTVSALGTCWYLALRAESDARAQAITEEIVVSKSRDSGLLSNPNAQVFEIRSVERVEV